MRLTKSILLYVNYVLLQHYRTNIDVCTHVSRAGAMRDPRSDVSRLQAVACIRRAQRPGMSVSASARKYGVAVGWRNVELYLPGLFVNSND